MIEPKNLLIVRTDRIGDVVLTLPLAGIIKKHYPDCRITFLVREYTRSLVENHPYIDNVLILREADGMPVISENKKMIRGNNFDSCVVVSPTFETAMIVFLGRIRERIGTGYRWYSFFFNNKVYQHRKHSEKHELEFNLEMLKKFNIDDHIDRETVRFDLKIADEDRVKVEKILADEKIDASKKIIVIHPGSGGSAMDLPAEKFKELVNQLELKNDVEIILTGNENEKKLCESVKGTSGAKNFAGKFNIGELAALIAKAGIFISNSTGPLHIAAALGTEVIGFYPRITACLPERWGPYSSKSAVFTPKLECSNCTREQCEKLKCMNSIEVSEVVSVIEKKLGIKAEK